MAEDAIAAAHESRSDELAQQQIEGLQTAVDGIVHGTDGSGFRPWAEVVEEEIVGFERAYQGDGIIGTRTGLVSLDAKLGGGFADGELVFVGGATGMGKTTLLAKMVTAATRAGGQVGWASPEMTGVQTVARALATETGVPVSLVRSGRLDDRQALDVFGRGGDLKDLPIWFDDTRGLGIAQIRSRALSLHRRTGGLTLYVFDHLQKIRDYRHRNRTQELGEAVLMFQTLAKEMDCPGGHGAA